MIEYKSKQKTPDVGSIQSNNKQKALDVGSIQSNSIERPKVFLRIFWQVGSLLNRTLA